MSTQIEITKDIVNYLSSYSYRSDKIIDELVAETRNLGDISEMQIAPEQGQFLELLVKLSRSKLCLEIGRFTGLSSLCMAKGLPNDGKVYSIDNSEEFLGIAKKYWEKAKVNNKIESILGQGINVLNELINKKKFFDLIFIDADKNNYITYYNLSLKLLKTNGLIVIDNVLWGGDVAQKSTENKSTNIIHSLNKKILNDNKVEFSLLPLADGISLIRKK